MHRRYSSAGLSVTDQLNDFIHRIHPSPHAPAKAEESEIHLLIRSGPEIGVADRKRRDRLIRSNTVCRVVRKVEYLKIWVFADELPDFFGLLIFIEDGFSGTSIHSELAKLRINAVTAYDKGQRVFEAFVSSAMKMRAK